MEKVIGSSSGRQVYLGDGVYADWDGSMVVLTTNDGRENTNRIYLEPAVLDALVAYTREVRTGPRLMVDDEVPLRIGHDARETIRIGDTRATYVFGSADARGVEGFKKILGYIQKLGHPCDAVTRAKTVEDAKKCVVAMILGDMGRNV
jgi:hypothetical protein